MNTSLYLFNESFRDVSNVAFNEFASAIERLLEACNFARENSDDIFRNNTIYSEVLYQGKEVYEVMYGNDLPRDYKLSLIKILDRAKSTVLTEQDQINILSDFSASEIKGLLCLYTIDNAEINDCYVIYSPAEWFIFHRTFLGRIPISSTQYYSGCKKYFPALCFHDRVEESLETLESGLVNFSVNIVRHLTQLNDYYKVYHIVGNRVESLRRFSTACSIDVSTEGNAARKPNFTFQFVDKRGLPVDVCCEPHMKMSNSDVSGDTHYYNNRIYFHEGKENIQGGKIMIGHIGGHL